MAFSIATSNSTRSAVTAVKCISCHALSTARQAATGIPGRSKISEIHPRRLTKQAAHSEPAEASATGQSEENGADVGKIDLRVGRIISVATHPEADDLYVEEVDVGEGQPRTIISGLRKYVAEVDLQGKLVVVVSNLKPRRMRGISSKGMLLCASSTDRSCIEPISPPSSATPGERIVFGDTKEAGEAASPNQVQKRKLWEKCVPYLRTDSEGVANFKGLRMLTSVGPVKSAIQNANLS